MKIIAVGWNYQSHNAEMAQQELPQAPVVFTMPETSLLKEGKPFFLPGALASIASAVLFSRACHLFERLQKFWQSIKHKCADRAAGGLLLCQRLFANPDRAYSCASAHFPKREGQIRGVIFASHSSGFAALQTKKSAFQT